MDVLDVICMYMDVLLDVLVGCVRSREEKREEKEEEEEEEHGMHSKQEPTNRCVVGKKYGHRQLAENGDDS